MARIPTACIPLRPEPADQWNEIASQFSSIVLGGGDIIPESNEWYVTSLLVAMQEQFYAYAGQLATESDPRTACCENLVKMAEDWGMYPRPAVAAQGYVLITGDADAVLVDPLEMTIGGADFRSVGVVPGRLNSQGAATVRFEALEAGAAAISGRARLTNAPEGVNGLAQILGSFCGGAAEETCEQFRSRFIGRLGYRPQATQGWIIEKLLEWPCVTRVCPRAGNCCDPEELECCPDICSENIGNEFYIFMDDTFDCGIAPQCVVDEISDWMFGPSPRKGRGLGQAPVGVCGNLVVPEAALFTIQIDSHECLSANQEAAIREAIAGFMRQFCPSEDLTYQQLTVVIGQILGAVAKFDIAFVGLEDGLTLTNCGLEVDCDVMPCVRSVRFTSPIAISDCSNG